MTHSYSVEAWPWAEQARYWLGPETWAMARRKASGLTEALPTGDRRWRSLGGQMGTGSLPCAPALLQRDVNRL